MYCMLIFCTQFLTNYLKYIITKIFDKVSNIVRAFKKSLKLAFFSTSFKINYLTQGLKIKLFSLNLFSTEF